MTEHNIMNLFNKMYSLYFITVHIRSRLGIYENCISLRYFKENKLMFAYAYPVANYPLIDLLSGLFSALIVSFTSIVPLIVYANPW